jgi:hypothetical protein
LIGKGKESGIYLFDNKTKGEIEPEELKRQLHFDMQTMIYLVALIEKSRDDDWPNQGKSLYKMPIKGVRYNVIRRPLSGGRGNIKQLEAKGKRKAETSSEYYARLH